MRRNLCESLLHREVFGHRPGAAVRPRAGAVLRFAAARYRRHMAAAGARPGRTSQPPLPPWAHAPRAPPQVHTVRRLYPAIAPNAKVRRARAAAAGGGHTLRFAS